MGCRKADGLREPGEGDGRAVRRRAVQRAPESVASRTTPRRVTGPASRIKDNFSPRTHRARPLAYLLPRSRVKAQRVPPAPLRRPVGPALRPSRPEAPGRDDGEVNDTSLEISSAAPG